MFEAIILAAGRGKRLEPLTNNKPKCQLEFLGKTLLERQIEIYKEQNAQRITVVTGYAADQITYTGLNILHNSDYANTNMLYSLMIALHSLSSLSEQVIISYADLVFEERLLRQLITDRSPASILVDQAWRSYWLARYSRMDCDLESLSYDNQSNLVEIGTSITDASLCQSRYIGMLQFSNHSIQIIKQVYAENYHSSLNQDQPWRNSPSFKQAYMTCFLQELIDRGLKIKALITESGWIEFDTLQDYQRALEWHRSGNLSDFIKM